MKVYVNPGHDTKYDSGAVNPETGLRECDVAAAVGELVRDYLEKAAGVPAVQSVVTWFFIGNEGLRVIENAAKAGVPVPKRLRDTLEQLTKEQEAKK